MADVAAPSPAPAPDALTFSGTNLAPKPRKLTKNQLKRERKKQKKEVARQQGSSVADSDTESVCSFPPIPLYCLHHTTC